MVFQWRRALVSDPRDKTLDEQEAAATTAKENALAAIVGTGITRKKAMNTRRKTATDSFEES